MRLDQFRTTRKYATFLFYFMNMVLFLVGVYLWLAHSIMRILILYPIFNMILFSASTGNDRYGVPTRGIVSANVSRFLGATLVVLLAWILAGNSQSLYARPLLLVVVMGMTIVFFALFLFVSGGRFESFALLIAISLVLLAGFGTYLGQPNLTDSPPYASVDAYRDYANAIRILSLARVDPGQMILQRYYVAFPVVPLESASISLVAGLPLSISHLFLSTMADSVAVAVLFLISKRVARDYGVSRSCLLFFPVLLIFLQPDLMDPAQLIQPLRVSIPIVAIVLYLAYTRILRSAPTRSVFFVLALLIMIVVPLHVTSAVLVMLVLGMMAFAAGSRKNAHASFMLAVLGVISLLSYLFFSVAFPFLSVLESIQEIWNMIRESSAPGSGLIFELASRALSHGSWGEVDSFLWSAGRALMLSVFTIFVVRLLNGGRGHAADPRQRRFFVMLGLLLVLGFGVGFQGALWGIDSRYFTYPLTPVAVIAATMVIVWVLGDMSPRGKLLVVGLLSLCVLSMVTAPSYLESNPAYVRMMPSESERVAAMFVSTNFDTQAGGVTQVVTDWPYYAEVRALLLSSHIGIERKVKIPTLTYEPVTPCQETMMLSRRYFMGSEYLQTISPYVKELSDNGRWSHFNRIYDAYSVSVYVGRLPC